VVLAAAAHPATIETRSGSPCCLNSAPDPPRPSRAGGEACSGQRSLWRSQALSVRSRSCWRGDPLPIASCHGEMAVRPGHRSCPERPSYSPDLDCAGAGHSQVSGQKVPPPARPQPDGADAPRRSRFSAWAARPSDRSGRGSFPLATGHEFLDRDAGRRARHVPVAAHVAEQSSVRLDADRLVTARDISPHQSIRNVPCSG
jgi:hypothetical protein